MMSTHFLSPLTIISVCLTLFMAFLFWLRMHKITQTLDIPNEKKNKTSIISGALLFGWFFLVLLLAILDFYHVSEKIISPLVPLGFAVPIIIGLYLMKTSATFQMILDRISQEWLIALQVYRIGGIVFVLLYYQGLLPAYFAFPSGVGDLVVGLSAPIVAFLYWKRASFSRSLAIAWNGIGILDLLIAIGSGMILVFNPPFQLIPVSPTTEIMTQFPLVLVPVFAVPFSLLLHLFSVRLLFKRK